MCGIVGAVAQRFVAPILLEGLRRLEYRGYDSAGMAILDQTHCIQRHRTKGKVAGLAKAIVQSPLDGYVGIAHTRWATHGEPLVKNAHPHICRQQIVLVHNGIIENHEDLKQQQLTEGYEFTSDTDTEVVVHQVYKYYQQCQDLFQAVKATIAELEGSYALGVIATQEPQRLIVTRSGSPLVIGIGIGEHFIASDIFALLPVTRRFIFLEEGDMADLTPTQCHIYDQSGKLVERPIKDLDMSADAVEKGQYRHYMLKEIFEQSEAIANTLEGRISTNKVLIESFGLEAKAIFAQIEAVQIVACGTSYHAGLIATYWLEQYVGLPCRVEVASEFRYRNHIVKQPSLFVTISQSGETADTLAALRVAKQLGYQYSLCICNVPESSLVRESDLVLMTRAGPEIGVASTKAFTTQLTALLLLVLALGRYNSLDTEFEHEVITNLRHLPSQVQEVLALEPAIEILSQLFNEKHHTLFLGRGAQYPVAMEGALKLKEISYIHAEAYPAGELKHGPLALIDTEMPVVAVAPNDELLEKLKSNLKEVEARGGQLFIFADQAIVIESQANIHVLSVPTIADYFAPIIYTIPLQLLAYHVAVLKGTDVDQPRNLAKSVTVE